IALGSGNAIAGWTSCRARDTREPMTAEQRVDLGRCVLALQDARAVAEAGDCPVLRDLDTKASCAQPDRRCCAATAANAAGGHVDDRPSRENGAVPVENDRPIEREQFSPRSPIKRLEAPSVDDP